MGKSLGKTMSEKEASQVLTSENSAEFYSNRLGLADTTPVEAVPTEPTEVKEQNEPVAEEPSKTTEEPKPNRLEKRFSDITKQRELARAEAERERTRASELEAKLKELEAKVNPKPVEQLSEPQPEQFETAFDYAKALAKYSTEEALRERDRQEAERRIAEERAKTFEAWNKRQAEVKAELPDYEDMLASSDVVVSDQIRDAIFESDVGPRILYHLAENPEVAEKLAKMSTISALRELGKIEARLEKAPQEEVKAVVRSNAPKPISPLRATSAASETPIDSEGRFTGTFQQWREARKAGKIR